MTAGVILSEVEESLCGVPRVRFLKCGLCFVGRGFSRDIKPPGIRTPLAAGVYRKLSLAMAFDGRLYIFAKRRIERRRRAVLSR